MRRMTALASLSRWPSQQEFCTMSGFEFTPKRLTATHAATLPVGRRLRFLPDGVAEGTPVTLYAEDGTTFAYPAGSMADVVAILDGGATLVVDTYERDDSLPTKAIVRATAVDCEAFVTVRGRPYVAGDDERRNVAPPSQPPKLAGKAEAAARVAAGRVAPAVPVSPPVTPPVTAPLPDAASEALRKLAEALGVTAPAAPAPAIDDDAVRAIAQEVADDTIGREFVAVGERMDDVEVAVTDLRSKVTDVLDALATATPAVRARVRAAVTPTKATGNPIGDALAKWYAIGEDRNVNALLLSPPSLGKSYAIREFGRAYDVYLEHGCSKDASEIDTLLGSPVPDSKGGFIVVDGVLTQAVRAASEGKSVLLLMDEILRLADWAQEWFLMFLTGRKAVDGSRSFVLRTRRVMPDGTLEVLSCPAENLHIVAAGNLGMQSPVEAFWSRWECIRFHFDPATIRAVSLSVLAANGVTGAAADKLAAAYTTIVTESRQQVAKGVIRYPADIRMLERSAAVSESTAKAVATTLAGRLVDNCANWSADLGDTDPESKAICDKWASTLLSLATSL